MILCSQTIRPRASVLDSSCTEKGSSGPNHNGTVGPNPVICSHASTGLVLLMAWQGCERHFSAIHPNMASMGRTSGHTSPKVKLSRIKLSRCKIQISHAVIIIFEARLLVDPVFGKKTVAHFLIVCHLSFPRRVDVWHVR